MNWYKKAGSKSQKIYTKCSYCDSWRMNGIWKRIDDEMSPNEIKEIKYVQKIAPAGISPDKSIMISHGVCDVCWERMEQDELV